MFRWFKKKLHRYYWQTTHTNKWQHSTRQKCPCGLTRDFEYYPNADEMKGMPWKLGRWVWSNGEESKYCTND